MKATAAGVAAAVVHVNKQAASSTAEPALPPSAPTKEGVANPVHTVYRKHSSHKVFGRSESHGNVKTATRIDGKLEPGIKFNVLPVEPGWLRAVVELLITSEWLGLGFRTLRFQVGQSSLKDLYTGLQTNIALLGALMLAIVVPIMFDAAEKSGIIGNIYYVLSWLAVLLYFVSCTWAVFLLIGVSQATSEEEVNLFLVKMADKNVLPVRLWVYASLTTGVFIQFWFFLMAENWIVLGFLYLISLLLISWLIIGVAGLVKNVYKSKIEMKQREMHELDPQAKMSPGLKMATYLSLPPEVVDFYVEEYAELFHADRLNSLTLQKYVLRSYPLGTLLTQASVARIDAAIARVVANDDSPARL